MARNASSSAKRVRRRLPSRAKPGFLLLAARESGELKTGKNCLCFPASSAACRGTSCSIAQVVTHHALHRRCLHLHELLPDFRAHFGRVATGTANMAPPCSAIFFWKSMKARTFCSNSPPTRPAWHHRKTDHLRQHLIGEHRHPAASSSRMICSRIARQPSLVLASRTWNGVFPPPSA